MSPLLLALAKQKEVDVSAHIDVATNYFWIALALVALFFLLRPELWRRIWFKRIDARGPALTRIALGITMVWTFLDLLFLTGEWFFTDQGMLMTDMARKHYGGQMRTLWDPVHGLEKWTDIFPILTDRWTVLFIRSDPPFVYSLFGLLFVFGTFMTIGLWTRVSTFMTWFLALQLYNYNPIYYTGGDTVIRVMMFLGIFADWGKAYSVDAWRARRKAIMGGAKQLPGLQRMAAWPIRLMMIQLVIVYTCTGILKSGRTWANGSALYYAMNLDHFYRIPAFYLYAWMDQLYITRAMTVVVHWWEVFFPLLFVGEALRAIDGEQAEGKWVGPVPRWSLYGLGFGASVAAVWAAPAWAKTAPLFVLAAIIYADRRWLKAPDTSGTSKAAWGVRVASWLCVLAGLVIAALLADLVIHYYYNPPKHLPPALQDKELIRKITAAATVAIPLMVTGLLVMLRAWTPRAYRFVRDWLLGKRLWLSLGVVFHIGIDMLLNVGTFPQVMHAVYPMWLCAADVEGMWRYFQWRAAKPGEAGRPPWPETKGRRVLRWLIAPIERAQYRVNPPQWVVVHAEAEPAVRRAALLRCWDVGERLRYELDPELSGEALVLQSPEGKRIVGRDAGRRLIALLPGLWWLWPFTMFPGAGRLALAILHQRS